ncbi:hypothetical protein RUM44_005351 [Polyplax serrata]|uniref:Tetraspanin n=1 Tax=Polyplax serrata TaxID=468196 RepID=A0ABR1ADA9_POLSC
MSDETRTSAILSCRIGKSLFSFVSDNRAGLFVNNRRELSYLKCRVWCDSKVAAIMSMDCGACWAKYLLCLFNFVFFIAGSVVLSIGIWIAADKSSFIEATKIIESTDVVDGLSQFTQPNVIHQVAYMLIASGAFIFIISFMGYCGAIKESRCLLTCVSRKFTFSPKKKHARMKVL